MKRIFLTVLLVLFWTPNIQAACDCASTDQANPCEGQTISVTVDGGTPNGGTAEDQVFNWAFNSNSGDARCGQFANGDYWIAPASGQTEVNVTAITTTSAGTLRADADPVMEGIGLLTGTRDYGNYDADEEIIVDLPIAYSGTNSLVAAIQRDEATNGNCGTSGIVGECIDAYNVVTILASVPAGAGSTVLRPNITGESKVMLSLTDFDFTRLPDSSLLDGATTAEFEEIRQRWSHSTEIFGLMSDGAGYSEGGRAFRSHQVIDDYGAGVAKRFNDDLMIIFSDDDPLSEKQAALAAMMAYGLDLYHGRYNGPGAVTRAWGAGATQSPGKFLPAVIVGSLLVDTTYLTTLKTASTYIHDTKVTGPHELAQVWPGVNNPVWGDGTTLTGENMHGGYWGALHIDNCYDGHTGSCAQDDVYDEHKPTGAKTQKDPYGYIDGPPNEAGSNYMPTSLGSQRAMVFASFLMPEICEAINYPDLAEYVVRVDSYGLKTAVDPCMTPDTRENKTWNTDSPTSWFWESTCDPYRNTGCVYYSGPTGTWGPIDPDNDDSGCIEADTNATVAQAFIDGYVQTGRFAALDGDAKTPGYSSAQVDANWSTIVTSDSCDTRYYIDFDAGSDSADGLTTSTPWKHAPNDANATDTSAGTSIVAGDTLIFKGGVHYRGTIVTDESGDADNNRITYDGNTAGTFGTGRAIIDGSDQITGWTACSSASDCMDAPNWANMYKASIPDGKTPINANMYEDNVMLWPAQEPNLTDPFFFDDTADYHTLDYSYVTVSTVQDTGVFTDADSTYYDGAYIHLWGGHNVVRTAAISSFDTSTDTVTFPAMEATALYDSGNVYHAMMNYPDAVDVAGEYFINETTDMVYLWPLTATNPDNSNVGVSVRSRGISISGESYLTIQGFTLQQHTGSTYAGCGVIDRADVGGDYITVQNNIVRWNSSDQGAGGIRLRNHGTNHLIDNNTVYENRDNRGIFLQGNDSVISNNTVYRNGGTAIGCYGCEGVEISDNYLYDNLGGHANGITVYESCDDVLITRNKVVDGNIALTMEDSTNITVSYNYFQSAGEKTVADWSGGTGEVCENYYFYNNVIENDGDKNNAVSLGSNCVVGTIIVKNNILDGTASSSKMTRSNNIYTALAYNQLYVEKYGWWTLGEGSSVELDKDVIFTDPSTRDFTLADNSPAIDAGIDVGLTTDFLENTVPYNLIPDIGAYEYDGESPPDPPGPDPEPTEGDTKFLQVGGVTGFTQTGTTKWSGGTLPPPTGQTEYAGWTEPESSNDQSYGAAGDRVYGREWTAISSGTANAINIYQRTSWATATYAYACLYNGNTLIGKSANLNDLEETDTWTGYQTITVEDGESLAFSLNDTLYMSYCADGGATAPIAYDSGDTDGVIKYENDEAWSINPPTPVDWEESSINGLMIILRYTTP